MKNIRHICFDLDGTLVDSYETILKTTLKTLQHLNIKDRFIESEFRKRIGHHFRYIFNELDIPVGNVEEFIEIYKDYYFDFIDDSVLYPNVINVLNELGKKGIKISLLTTKGQDQADKIIGHFKLRKYFSLIMGRRIDIAIKPSPDSLNFICNELKVDPSETIMVGDAEVDIECAKNAGAFCCAVTYGYRSRKLLEALNPDFIIDHPEEILKIQPDKFHY
jgi:HAD superfamily hydrolase (TIGR01549 family)